jgi:diadenosine tetraphosphate (Ap4A) HIT family hydrolase
MPETSQTNPIDCPLCHPQGETLVWQEHPWRVIMVDDARFPGYTRLIHDEHVQEMSDLSVAQRNQCMDIICGIETAMRRVLEPDKINLAQFGNMVPHLHWHIIPRRRDDPHFPESIWGPAATRLPSQHQQWADKTEQILGRLDEYRQALKATLS